MLPLSALHRLWRLGLYLFAILLNLSAWAAPVSATLRRTSQWQGGYNGRMTLTNPGTTTLTNWTLVFTTKDQLTFWGNPATVSGTTWTVKPPSWATSIPAKGSVNVDFGATTTAAAGWDPWSTCTFNGEVVAVDTGTTPTVSVTLTPATATLAPGATFAFTATVTGSTNTAVTWKATRGTVSIAGLYTAPTTEGNDTVTAASVADPTKSASAAVTVKAATALSVAISPTSATVAPGAPFSFAATVIGSTNTSVTWRAARGTVSTAGLYTAPATEGADTVTATSVVDLTKSATAAITVKKPATASGTLTFRRTSGWAGGYQGSLSLLNSSTTALAAWTLTFDSADSLSLYGGNAFKSGTTWTVTPSSWSPAIPAGGTWTSSLGAAYTTSDWNPPTQATLNGTAIPVEVIDDMPSIDGNAIVATFPEYESAARPLNQITVGNGTTRLAMKAAGGMVGPFTVLSNHPELVEVAIADGGATLVVTSKSTAGGRAGLRLKDTVSGKERSFSLRVKDSAGALPGFPSYVSVGVCSEDTAGDLGMFRGFQTGDLNRRADNRYIYLNGGPSGANCWWNWTSVPGDRARTYIRYSQRFGLIPTFVWYNIPDAAENYPIDLAHIQDATYMQAYFDLLKRTMALFNQESKDELIMLVLEPDFIGYMMQQSGKQPSQISAQVMTPLRAAGLITATDPTFSDTLDGLVTGINHVLSRDCPQVRFGWQINVWSSPDPLPAGVNTLIKATDAGWASGRAFIQAQAQKVAAYYTAAGITSKAHFISFDKYGYDAAGATPGCATDPAPSPWFWNSDHWNNYLFFVKQLNTVTTLPVALWQLPVGRVNASLAANPNRSDNLFLDLTNTTNRYEDSCSTFFFGDAFQPGAGNRWNHFVKNLAADPALKVSGSTLTWGPHFQAAKEAGVFNIMFGDGIGDSTRARPKTDAEPTDGWWLMTALQRYLRNPVPLN